MPKNSDSMNDTKPILKKVWQIIEEKQGQEVTILDVREIASFTSFFVICEGRNKKQLQAICDELTHRLKKEEGLRPSHIEGFREAQWILLDYLEFVIHIFDPKTRSFYAIERLWSDGVRLEAQALSA